MPACNPPCMSYARLLAAQLSKQFMCASRWCSSVVSSTLPCWQMLELHNQQASLDGTCQPPRSAAARGFVRLLSDDAAFEEVFAIGERWCAGLHGSKLQALTYPTDPSMCCHSPFTAGRRVA